MKEKLFKKVCAWLLSVMVILSAGVTNFIPFISGGLLVNAETRSEDGRYKYILHDDGVHITWHAPSDYRRDFIIPDTIDGKRVTEIGSWVFRRSNMSSITIPNSVTSIGSNAFSECSALTSVTIPSSVTTLGAFSFSKCTNLSSITIPDRITEIPIGVFSECESLTSVTIPNSVTTIGKEAFYGCKNLTSVTIPDSVTTIEEGAFSECEKLTSIIIPDSVTTIEEKAFLGCRNLADKNNFIIVRNVLYGYSGEDKNVIIPDGVTIISADAFKHSFPIGIVSVTIPASVTYIGDYAFGACQSLSSVKICGKTPKLGNEVFYNTQNLQDEKGFVIIGDLLYAYLGSDKKITIPDGITKIEKHSFEGCDITHVTMPDTIISIGDHSFNKCENLTSVTISNGVTNIGYEAFCACKNLTSFNIPASVTNIGTYAFAGCENLTSVVIPDSMTIIEEYTFAGCDNLSSVTIPDSITNIGNNAFTYSALKEAIYYGTEESFNTIKIRDTDRQMLSKVLKYKAKPETTVNVSKIATNSTQQEGSTYSGTNLISNNIAQESVLHSKDTDKNTSTVVTVVVILVILLLIVGIIIAVVFAKKAKSRSQT